MSPLNNDVAFICIICVAFSVDFFFQYKNLITPDNVYLYRALKNMIFQEKKTSKVCFRQVKMFDVKKRSRKCAKLSKAKKQSGFSPHQRKSIKTGDIFSVCGCSLFRCSIEKALESKTKNTRRRFTLRSDWYDKWRAHCCFPSQYARPHWHALFVQACDTYCCCCCCFCLCCCLVQLALYHNTTVCRPFSIRRAFNWNGCT